MSHKKLLWVIEYASEKQWTKKHITVRMVLDAGASQKDGQPIWLCHNHNLEFVFDRSSGEMKGHKIPLQRPANTPLSRMETNLRPVRTIPVKRPNN